MSPIPIVTELENLIRKYEDVCTPLDLLRMIGSASKLEEANILLHERMKKDVYSLFGKSEDGTMLSLTGSHLLQASRVTKFHSAHSCNQFYTDAVVELSETNTPTHGEVASTKPSGKRKRSEQFKLVLDEPVYLNYVFSEQTVGAESGSGNAKREKGVSVMESPYKSINLTITVCRGVGGLDKAVLLDFQLLTAGCSPSDQQISLQNLVDGQQGQHCEGGEEGEENESHGGDSDEHESGSDEGGEGYGGEDGSDGEEGSEEGSQEGSDHGTSSAGGDGGDDGEDQEDTADYYNVNVSTEVLAQLKDWLKYRSLAEQQQDETSSSRAEEQPLGKMRGKRGLAGEEQNEDDSQSQPSSDAGADGDSPYDKDPALGDLLQFLLSFPYVDEAWGIQDLILDHELGGAEEDDSQGEGEGGSDAESGDEDKYCYPCSMR